MKYFLGLDNGGTTTKATIFDSRGRQIATSSLDTNMITTKPGYTERDMEEMWRANCSVICEALKQSKIKGQDIQSVSVCGHGKGLYLWGYNNHPVRNGIISTDNRAWKYPRKWQEDGTEKNVFDISCQHILASQPVSLLAWLKDNEPSALKETKYIFACKDYIRFRLTGEAYGEITDYSGCNFVNLHTGEYDIELLRLFGLEDMMDKLPSLRHSTDICGYITKEAAEMTGLREGVPVVAGAFDIDACALAVGITDETNICMIAGTWSINEYIRKMPIMDGSVMMNSFYCLPGYYLVEECSPTSAGNSAWFAREVLPELSNECRTINSNIYDIMNSWVDEIETNELCPIYLPFIMGSNVHQNAMGSFVGISNFHDRKHLARSVYEGVAFSHRYHLEKLLKTREKLPNAIRLAGGVARSRVWTQMFADVMKLPIESVDVEEAGTLGCAILGSLGTGFYSNVEEAITNMTSISQAIVPNKESSKIYDAKYDLYCKVIEAIDSVWDDLQNYKESQKHL